MHRTAGRVQLAGAAVLLGVSSVVGATPGAPRESFEWRLPAGFPQPAVPADNPMSESKVALGRRLFFEERLSITGRMSCATCHDPARAWSDGRPRARGALGDALPRGAMSLTNVAYNSRYGWTGRSARTLEAQMREPLLARHPLEMGLRGREAGVSGMLRADAAYAAGFRQAFPDDPEPIGIGNLIRAIAAFERTLLSGDSPFDHYVFRGEHDALDEAQKRGLALFYSARLGCANCHAGFNFTGTWTQRDRPAAAAALARDGVGAPLLRVPTLRNIALTAPYMHDGRYATLEEVVAHYEADGWRVGAADRSRPTTMRRLAAFRLSADERRDLIAFLRSLTDEAFVASGVRVRALAAGDRSPPEP